MGEKKEENFSVSYPLGKFLLNSIDWRCPKFFFGTITSKFALAALIVMEILLSISLVMVFMYPEGIVSQFALQFPPDTRFLYISITESVKPHRQRFSYKPRRGKEKFKEAFFPRLLPFLASLVIVILRIVVA